MTDEIFTGQHTANHVAETGSPTLKREPSGER
jgi:hypothetical protein